MINERIKTIRNHLSLSQREFGRMLRVTGSYISQVEASRIKPSEDFLKSLVRVFNVDRGWLETGTDQMLPQSDHLSFGDRLKIARTRRGYTQGGLAKMVECNRNSISTAERGETMPSTELIAKLCKSLWINESWLRFGVGTMERSEIVAEVLDIIRSNTEVRDAVKEYLGKQKNQDC